MASLWRKEDPVLSDKGAVIAGGMWQHQRQWWDSPMFIKALVAGYGSGKTMIAGKRAISLALHNAPSPHLSVSPSYKIARRTIVPMIQSLLRGKQTIEKGLKYRFNKSDFEFTIEYGTKVGTIWVTSGDDPESLKGPNVGSANIDEPFMQDRDVFTQVQARVRDPQALVREIGLTGTPEELNWGYEICEGEDKEKYEIEVFHASTFANKALPPEYAQRLLKSLTPAAAQAYLEGRFVSLVDGLVYYAFTDANVQDLPTPAEAELGAGMDFNVDPMAAVVFWKIGNHMHIFEEIELPNADTQYMCSELTQRHGARLRTIYPDATGRARKTASPAGKTDFHYIREAGFEISCDSVNPPRKDRYNAVNGKLGPKTGPITLTISPKCKKLIGYCKQYAHKKMNEEYQKAMSHLLDAAGYPVARLFPVKPRSGLIPVIGA